MRRKLISYTMPDGRRPAGRFSVILSAVLAVVVVVLGGLNVYQYSAMKELREQLSDKSKSFDELQVKYSDTSDQVIDMKNILVEKKEAAQRVASLAGICDAYVRFVSEGSNYYHRLGCPNLNLERFYAFNLVAAEKFGYVPCPECSSSSSEIAQEISDDISKIYNLTALKDFGQYIENEVGRFSNEGN